MLNNRLSPDDPFEWLNRAQSSLSKAKNSFGNKEIYLEDICFDLQQAAEKAIKAVLILYKINFPRTHDLGHLLFLLEKNGQKVPENIKEAAVLNEYAVETRYPGWSEPVTDEEYSEALDIAEKVMAWANKLVSS